MISILKQWPLPKGIKDFIWNSTDFQTNKTLKTSRFVSRMEMYNGKPIKRVFGFLSASQFRSYEDIMVKEIARFYDHKMYLGYVSCNLYNGNKTVYYDVHPDRFEKWDSIWTFYDQPMINPEEFLEQNSLHYTGWNKDCDMPFFDYICRYIDNPKIELLSKAGLGWWVQYIRYLDTSKKSLHEVFKIKQECLPLLKEPTFGLQELFVCRKTGYSDIRKIVAKVALNQKRKELLRQYSQQFTKDDSIIQVINDEKTAEYCSKRHTYFFCNDYIDYLKDLVKLGAITDRKMLYPADFLKAHAEVSKQVKLTATKRMIEGFLKQYEAFAKYTFAEGMYLIRPVKEPNELYVESSVLHHCVRTYDENVAAGTTEIMFIRKKDDPETPFYTLELKKEKVIQVRGEHNKTPEGDVRAVVGKWAKHFKISYTADQPYIRYY